MVDLLLIFTHQDKIQDNIIEIFEFTAERTLKEHLEILEKNC